MIYVKMVRVKFNGGKYTNIIIFSLFFNVNALCFIGATMLCYNSNWINANDVGSKNPILLLDVMHVFMKCNLKAAMNATMLCAL